MRLNEDATYPASRDIGDIRFRIVDKLDTLQYALIPKTSKDLDKMSELKSKYNFSDGDIQQILASYLSKPGMDLEPDYSYRGAGYGVKLIKPKLG